MCGISLLLAPGRDDLAALLEMHRLQAHRGPDGEGFLTVDRRGAARASAQEPVAWDEAPLVAAAFRRLKIQDTSPLADQPMPSRDGRRWLLMNGEVYNFQQLRDELEGRGHAFRSRGDAEVVLAAYEEWGPSCVERFNGMWAFVVVDLDRRVLFASRDRIGIKPLFYARVGGGLWLASEAAALGRAAGRGADAAHLRGFLEGSPPQEPNGSFFDGVRAVPAGCTFELELGTSRVAAPEFRRYWSLDSFRWESREPADLADAAFELREELTSSVRLRSVADVPVAALLSGGLDSSLVAALLARSSQAPARTYSLVYDDPSMDESLFIGAVLGASPERFDAHRKKADPELFWGLTDRVVRAQGEPLLGWDLLAQYEAYRQARRGGSIVVLDGQGPDETLGGYGSHELAALRDAVRRGPLLRSAAEIRDFGRRRGRSTLSVMRGLLQPALARAGRPRVHGYDWLEPRDERSGDAGASGRPATPGSHLDHLLREKTVRTNLPTVLVHQDKSSMAHGVESRVPHLDHRLVELCFRLPPEYKVRRGVRKLVLREAARTVLPSIVAGRMDKRAFVSNLRWFPLRRWESAVRDAVSGSDLAALSCIRSDAVARFVDGYFRSEHEDVLGVWRLFTTARWLELLRSPERSPAPAAGAAV